MLKLNIKRLLDLRGISKPSTFLKRWGFNYYSSSAIFRGKVVQLKVSQIEKLCLAFKCTPNELFEWVGDGNVNENPLCSLKRDEKLNTNELMKSIPLAELEDFVRTKSK